MANLPRIPVELFLPCFHPDNLPGRLAGSLEREGWEKFLQVHYAPIVEKINKIGLFLKDPWGQWVTSWGEFRPVWCGYSKLYKAGRFPHLTNPNALGAAIDAHVPWGNEVSFYIGSPEPRDNADDIYVSMTPYRGVNRPHRVLVDALAPDLHNAWLFQAFNDGSTTLGVEALPNPGRAFDSVKIPWVANVLSINNVRSWLTTLRHPGMVLWRGDNSGDGTLDDAIRMVASKPGRRLVLGIPTHDTRLIDRIKEVAV